MPLPLTLATRAPHTVAVAVIEGDLEQVESTLRGEVVLLGQDPDEVIACGFHRQTVRLGLLDQRMHGSSGADTLHGHAGGRLE
jgi:hypothetical protein